MCYSFVCGYRSLIRSGSHTKVKVKLRSFSNKICSYVGGLHLNQMRPCSASGHTWKSRSYGQEFPYENTNLIASCPVGQPYLFTSTDLIAKNRNLTECKHNLDFIGIASGAKLSPGAAVNNAFGSESAPSPDDINHTIKYGNTVDKPTRVAKFIGQFSDFYTFYKWLVARNIMWYLFREILALRRSNCRCTS